MHTRVGKMSQNRPECLLKVVGEAMKVEPSLEAVKVDHDRRAISIATLGAPRVQEIEAELTKKIATLEEENKGTCGLLRGDGSCGTCYPPSPDSTLRFLDVRKEGNATTIARVSCPTSP